MSRKRLKLFDSALIGPAIVDAFRKLDPRTQLRSPVMFVVYVGSIITTLLFFQAVFSQGEAPAVDHGGGAPPDGRPVDQVEGPELVVVAPPPPLPQLGDEGGEPVRKRHS